MAILEPVQNLARLRERRLIFDNRSADIYEQRIAEKFCWNKNFVAQRPQRFTDRLLVKITKHCVSIALILGVTIANAGQLKDLDTQSLTGTVIDKPKLIKDFSLTNSNGKPFTAKNLKNHWTFLFFGFTRCGYVCPTSMTTLKQVYAELQKMPHTPKPQVIFVSIDPERDDLSRIHHYVTSFNPDFMGATGNKATLNQLTSQLGILYMKITRADQKTTSSNNYDMDHTGSILLVDPDGALIAVFSMPHQVNRMSKDYHAITSHFVIPAPPARE